MYYYHYKSKLHPKMLKNLEFSGTDLLWLEPLGLSATKLQRFIQGPQARN